MKPFSSRPRWHWLTLLAVVVIVAVLMLRARHNAAPAAIVTANAGPAALEMLPGDVITLKTQDLRRVLPLSGALRAVNQAAVRSRIAGDVLDVLVREGETVKAGQPLVKLDTRETQAKLDQAKGSQLANRAQLDIATKTRDNNKSLLDQGFISRNAFDNAASQYDIAVANLESARGALDVAQKALGDTIVRAPIDGVISSRSVQPGEKVAIDAALLTIVDLRQLEMEAPVPSADILQVALGQEVQVRVEGLPQAVIGKVVRINPATQSGSRSILVYVRIDNTQGNLRAGMFADASLTLQRKPGVLSAPAAAVQSSGDERFVYTVENNILQRRSVKIGMTGMNDDGDAVEIVSGVQAGAQVVKANLGNLPAGATVRFAAVKG